MVAVVEEELKIGRIDETSGNGLWLTLVGVPLTFVKTIPFPELSDKKEAPYGVSSSNCVPAILGNIEVGGVKFELYTAVPIT